MRNSGKKEIARAGERYGLDTRKNPTKVLLIKRKNEPFAGAWALPGGFVELDEALEDAVARKLLEETGLDNIALKQLHAFGKLGRDPRGWSVAVAYVGLIDDRDFTPVTPVAADDADDAEDVGWFDVEELPSLAFDHNTIIGYAIQ